MTLKCCVQDRKLHLPAVTDCEEHNFSGAAWSHSSCHVGKACGRNHWYLFSLPREVSLEAERTFWLTRAQSTLVFPSRWSSSLCKPQPFSMCQFLWQYMISQQQSTQLCLNCETKAHKSSQHGQPAFTRAARQSKSCEVMFMILSSWGPELFWRCPWSSGTVLGYNWNRMQRNRGDTKVTERWVNTAVDCTEWPHRACSWLWFIMSREAATWAIIHLFDCTKVFLPQWVFC